MAMTKSHANKELAVNDKLLTLPILGLLMAQSAASAKSKFLSFIIITAGMLGSAEASRFLKKYMNEALGPILIVLGFVLLGWIGTGAFLQIGAEKLQEKAKKGRLLWAVPIGFLFALSFIEIWIRRLAGTTFILAGIYYYLTHIYGLFV